MCDLFAALRRCDRIHVAGKNEYRNMGRDRLAKVGRYFPLWPHATGPRLLKDAIIPEWIARVQARSFVLVNKGDIFSTRDRKVHPIRDEIGDRWTNGLAQKWPEIAVRSLMDDQWDATGLVSPI